jgi:hypothetical protein
MGNSMKEIKGSLIGLAMVLQMGCLPSSDNPLPSQGDITQIASPFLGDWLLTAIQERSNVGYLTLNVQLQGTTELVATRSDGTNSAEMVLTMNRYGSRYFVTHDRQSEVAQTYAVYEVILSGTNNNTLRVYPLNSILLEASVGSGQIQGIVRDVGETRVVRITDTPANLESYVVSSPTVFDATPLVQFTKQ